MAKIHLQFRAATAVSGPQDRYIAPEMQSFSRVYRFGHDLLVPTRVGGAPLKLFVLDTGAWTHFISPAAAREATKIHGDPDMHVEGMSGSGQAWKNGKFLVLRKSIRKRLLAKVKQVKDELRMRMHQPLADVGKWLRSVVQGYFNYHAVPGNSTSLQRFRREVSKRWPRALHRRSQKSRISWKHLTIFAAQWLPQPRILHPYPYMRFDAQYLR